MTEAATKTQPASTPEEDTRPKILEVKNLKTYFSSDGGTVRAVDGVSFWVREGESVGIVGESGSGKSVTQISILGLIPSPPGRIAGGEILFRGEDLLKKSAKELRDIRGNQISMIWQDPMTSLNPFLRISRQLMEPLRIHKGMDKQRARKAAIEMLDKVGIPGAAERIDQYPHQFSGGMRQRVMIAMALLCQPKLLIADEPTTALDVTIQAQILELIKALRTDLGTSVVTITHDLGVVAGISDRVIVMYAGRIMEEAPADALFYSPAHPYTVGLLKSVPRLDRGRVESLIPIEGRPPDTSKDIPGCPFVDRCPWAVEKCRQRFPEPVDLGGGHRSFCWRADEVFAAGLGTNAPAGHAHAVEAKIRAGGTIDVSSARSEAAGTDASVEPARRSDEEVADGGDDE